MEKHPLGKSNNQDGTRFALKQDSKKEYVLNVHRYLAIKLQRASANTRFKRKS
jgi:hypothetical protein